MVLRAAADFTPPPFDVLSIPVCRSGQGTVRVVTPQVVLIHGLGDSRRGWTRVEPLLAQAGLEPLAIDLPGFGDEPPFEGSVSLERLADWVVRRMDGVGFHVAGNSLGGGIALELARRGAVASACAIGPIGFREGWERGFQLASLHSTRLMAKALARLGELPGPVRRAASFQMMHHAERVPADAHAAIVRGLARAPGFTATAPATVGWSFAHDGPLPCPTTIAWGEHDRLHLFRRQAPRARSRVPHASHVTLRGVGHTPMWDDPPLIASVIAETAARAR